MSSADAASYVLLPLYSPPPPSVMPMASAAYQSARMRRCPAGGRPGGHCHRHPLHDQCAQEGGGPGAGHGGRRVAAGGGASDDGLRADRCSCIVGSHTPAADPMRKTPCTVCGASKLSVHLFGRREKEEGRSSVRSVHVHGVHHVAGHAKLAADSWKVQLRSEESHPSNQSCNQDGMKQSSVSAIYVR
jgi:hypothetical protein